MNAVTKHVQRIRTEWSLDAVVVNAENASDGSGLLPNQHDQLIDAGVDGITLGDHIYRRKEIISTLQRSDRIVKPANYPTLATGKTRMLLKTIRGTLGVISVMGRTYMRAVDCPFEAMDREIEAMGNSADAILVDIHAEATSDKQALARHLDGRVTAVLGTHTHVPTADGRVLPGGTALQCDVGMCGPYESIIGRDCERVIGTTRTFEPQHFHVATEDVRLCGAIIESDKEGLAKSIERFEISSHWEGR